MCIQPLKQDDAQDREAQLNSGKPASEYTVSSPPMLYRLPQSLLLQYPALDEIWELLHNITDGDYDADTSVLSSFNIEVDGEFDEKPENESWKLEVDLFQTNLWRSLSNTMTDNSPANTLTPSEESRQPQDSTTTQRIVDRCDDEDRETTKASNPPNHTLEDNGFSRAAIDERGHEATASHKDHLSPSPSAINVWANHGETEDQVMG
jgi:hypothetical protein